MALDSLKVPATKPELKKRIMDLQDISKRDLTETYMNELSLEGLEELYLIAETMRIERKM